MPVLVSLLAVDIAALFDSESGLTTGNVLGFAIRYVILFAVGGVVAWLHEDEIKSFKLFELGIAAPALITSLVTAQGVVARGGDLVPVDTTFRNVSIMSEAHARGDAPSGDDIVVAGLIGDVISGITGSAYKKVGSRRSNRVDESQGAGDDKRRAEQETRTLRREPEAQRARQRTEQMKIEQLQAEAAAARARVQRLERELRATRNTSQD